MFTPLSYRLFYSNFLHKITPVTQNYNSYDFLNLHCSPICKEEKKKHISRWTQVEHPEKCKWCNGFFSSLRENLCDENIFVTDSNSKRLHFWLRLHVYVCVCINIYNEFCYAWGVQFPLTCIIHVIFLKGEILVFIFIVHNKGWNFLNIIFAFLSTCWIYTVAFLRFAICVILTLFFTCLTSRDEY